MPALTETSSSRPTPPWRPLDRNSPPQQGKGGSAAAAKTPACPKPTKKPIIRKACPTIPARISISKPDPPRRHSNQPDHSQMQRLKTPREKSGSCISRRRFLTSPEDAWRAVSPESRSLPAFQELLRPAVVKALGDPLPAAQLGDAVLAAQARQHNPDLLFSRILLACLAANISYRLVSTRRRTHGFLSHLRSLRSLRWARNPPLRNHLNLSHRR